MSIHIAANGIILFFIMAEQYSSVFVCVCVCVTLFLHSSVNGHLDCFHVLLLLSHFSRV